MKKNRMFDTKGFMLVETLLVSLTISGILVYMYAQFSTINNAYQRLYDFNTASSLYRTATVREFLMTYTKSNSNLYSGLTAKNITCSIIPSINSYDKNYCNKIFEVIDAKQVILTRDNFDENRVLNLVSDAKEKKELNRFLNTIKRYGTEKKRLIIIFNDGTIATVLLKF